MCYLLKYTSHTCMANVSSSDRPFNTIQRLMHSTRIKPRATECDDLQQCLQQRLPRCQTYHVSNSIFYKIDARRKNCRANTPSLLCRCSQTVTTSFGLFMNLLLPFILISASLHRAIYSVPFCCYPLFDATFSGF